MADTVVYYFNSIQDAFIPGSLSRSVITPG